MQKSIFIGEISARERRWNMDTSERGSVSHWISALKAGDEAATQALWERYFEQLVRLAGARLRAAHQGRAAEDEEDAALSAFDSLCEGARRGRFPKLVDRVDLWSLLVVITKRKAWDQVERGRARKRGGGLLARGALTRGSGGDDLTPGIDQIIGDEPTPEFAAMVAEEYRNRLDRLPDPTLRQIAVWKMEGYTGEEIAERLGCSPRTVANKLKWIRLSWEEAER
jgi:DNA-directed RNA polymerase specialized sigma24 family protein